MKIYIDVTTSKHLFTRKILNKVTSLFRELTFRVYNVSSKFVGLKKPLALISLVTYIKNMTVLLN